MAINKQNWEAIRKDEEAALLTSTMPLSVEIDINSNVCEGSDGDSGTESDDLSSPVSASCNSTQSDLDELPTDIDDIHTNIALVAERMDWLESNGTPDRRPSLPLSQGTPLTKELYGRRESFPRIHDNRRTCLPHTSLYQAISFDRLVEKLTSMEKDSAAGGTHSLSSVNLDDLLCESRLSTLSPNIETSKITNYLLAKPLLSK